MRSAFELAHQMKIKISDKKDTKGYHSNNSQNNTENKFKKRFFTKVFYV